MHADKDTPLLRRDGSNESHPESFLWPKDYQEYTLDDAIDKISGGKFLVFFFMLTGFAWIVESMELVIISILSPILMCEWSLSAYQEALIATVAFIGMAMGSIVWGYFSDVYGRKKVLIACFTFVLLFGISSSRAPSYALYLPSQFFLGFGVGGGPQIAVIVTEMLPVKHRGSSAVIMLAFFWSLGSIYTVVIAMLTIRSWNWRDYLLVVLSPVLIFLLGSYWVPESPRYLLSTGKATELKALLKRIAKFNGKSVPEGKLVGVKVRTNSGSVLDLFAENGLTPVILSLLFFTLHYTYHGIVLLTTSMRQTELDGCHPYYTSSINSTQNTTSPPNQRSCKQFTNQDYQDIVTTTLAELPAVLVAYVLIDRIGRRKAVVTQLTIATISFVLLSICTARQVSIVFMFITRGLIVSCVQTVYIYAAEVLPTNVRAVGVGLICLFGRVGAIVTPFVAEVLIHRSFYLVILAYAVPLVLCIVASLLLRIETNQRVLQDSSKMEGDGTYEALE